MPSNKEKSEKPKFTAEGLKELSDKFQTAPHEEAIVLARQIQEYIKAMTSEEKRAYEEGLAANEIQKEIQEDSTPALPTPEALAAIEMAVRSDQKVESGPRPLDFLIDRYNLLCEKMPAKPENNGVVTDEELRASTSNDAATVRFREKLANREAASQMAPEMAKIKGEIKNYFRELLSKTQDQAETAAFIGKIKDPVFSVELGDMVHNVWHDLNKAHWVNTLMAKKSEPPKEPMLFGGNGKQPAVAVGESGLLKKTDQDSVSSGMEIPDFNLADELDKTASTDTESTDIMAESLAQDDLNKITNPKPESADIEPNPLGGKNIVPLEDPANLTAGSDIFEQSSHLPSPASAIPALPYVGEENKQIPDLPGPVLEDIEKEQSPQSVVEVTDTSPRTNQVAEQNIAEQPAQTEIANDDPIAVDLTNSNIGTKETAQESAGGISDLLKTATPESTPVQPKQTTPAVLPNPAEIAPVDAALPEIAPKTAEPSEPAPQSLEEKKAAITPTVDQTTPASAKEDENKPEEAAAEKDVPAQIVAHETVCKIDGSKADTSMLANLMPGQLKKEEKDKK